MHDLDPEIAAVFLDEARGYLARLDDPAVAAAEKITAAHSLKSAAGLVGLTELRAAAEEAERYLRAGEPSLAAEPLARAATLLRQLAETVTPPHALDAAEAAEAGALGDGSGFDPEEARLLRGFFLDEAAEHLDGITRALIELEKQPRRRELVDELFRKTHTLKGSAATIGLRAASEAAHRLEDVFAHIRAGRLALDQAVFDALGAAVDLVRAVAEAETPQAARDLLDRLVLACAELGARAGAAAPRREVTPTGDRFAAAAAADAVPEPVEGGSSGRFVRALAGADDSRGDSQSGPHPEPTADDHSRDDDGGGLFDDRRSGERRRDEPHILRVDVTRVDALMDAVGELVFDRTRLERRGQELRTVARDLGKSRAALRMLLTPLRQAVAAAQSGAPPSLDAITALTARVTELEAELAEHATALARATATLVDDTDALHRTSSQLAAGLTQVRMVKMRALFQRLMRPARGAARRAGKRIELHTSGDETELDKTVVEQITDPLIQLLRNAVVHGIEPPDARVARGKPPVGRITMSARHQGDSVYLEVADDGGGIDLDRIRVMLVASGRMSEAQARAAKDDRVLVAIFEAGMSTAEAADELAGRGVGLDVVRDSIARLGGEISVTSVPGEGARFTMRLPLTTAISQALLFKVGGQVYALPSVHVIETIAIEGSTPAFPSLLRVHDDAVPLVSLHDLLGADPPGDARKLSAVIVQFAGRRFAATCDKLIGPREIVVKSIGPLLAPLGIYAGATISGAGKVQLILDPAALAQLAYPTQALGDVPAGAGLDAATAAAAAAAAAAVGRPTSARDTGSFAAIRPSGQMAAVAAPPRRILVADDSKSVREAVSRMLSAAGYIVDLAADGAEALSMLHDVDYDLLVTDLEMPRVGGFELIQRLRDDRRFLTLPVMVISSRSTEPNRSRAAQLGVQVFLAKPVSKAGLVEQVAGLLR